MEWVETKVGFYKVETDQNIVRLFETKNLKNKTFSVERFEFKTANDAKEFTDLLLEKINEKKIK